MKIFLLMLCTYLLPVYADAKPRIAVLDFELNDITSLPNTPAERQRTAGFAPLLISTLNAGSHFTALSVAAASQQQANAGFGYLFRYPEQAAPLGQMNQADWVIVAQHSKPSFLYSELWVYLVEVKTGKTLTSYHIELKGNHDKVSQRAITALAAKIETTLAGGG
ncbi:DUF2380 domain-containing protein [Methylomonas paludis]|uniref:DUF2380 domain-containing protein n=1 Tax=Methylomonas paludis TaxID=1173101 RepID=A0A975R9U1_9GAMM|nr:DUF2380 domain-containing protein [Methylomonas paludis]QWF70594.1 DUF2380 domain-containing protein [Methylomonas paludis]